MIVIGGFNVDISLWCFLKTGKIGQTIAEWNAGLNYLPMNSGKKQLLTLERGANYLHLMNFPVSNNTNCGTESGRSQRNA